MSAAAIAHDQCPICRADNDGDWTHCAQCRPHVAAAEARGHAKAVAQLRDATALLIAHTRYDIRSCHCGWAELGRSHPEHVLAVLADHLEAQGATT